MQETKLEGFAPHKYRGQKERCQSGRMGRSRKPLYGLAIPRVRIPLSPPPYARSVPKTSIMHLQIVLRYHLENKPTNLAKCAYYSLIVGCLMTQCARPVDRLLSQLMIAWITEWFVIKKMKFR